MLKINKRINEKLEIKKLALTLPRNQRKNHNGDKSFKTKIMKILNIQTYAAKQ